MNHDLASCDAVLEEVNNLLRTHPYIRTSATVMRKIGEQADILAYVVPTTLVSCSEVLDYCRQHLPETHVPSSVVLVAELPAALQGDDGHLAVNTQLNASAKGSTPAIVDGEEGHISQTFANTLGLGNIGRQDNFFSLGGHSLLAARVVAALNKRFGTSLTLQDVFSNPTVAGLATRLRGPK